MNSQNRRREGRGFLKTKTGSKKTSESKRAGKGRNRGRERFHLMGLKNVSKEEKGVWESGRYF